MRRDEFKRRFKWGVGALICLAASYWLCRFALFDLHGMKQWPNFLAAVGLGFILIAFAANLRWVAVAVALGYIVGFGIGVLFNRDALDAGGGGTNNLWMIWTVSFFIIVLIGFMVDMLKKYKSRR